jgi:hypothetical protein
MAYGHHEKRGNSFDRVPDAEIRGTPNQVYGGESQGKLKAKGASGTHKFQAGRRSGSDLDHIPAAQQGTDLGGVIREHDILTIKHYFDG